jgi:signal transduction histidine kinase
MRLASFIRSNIEKISAEWEVFAATLLPQEEFSASVLRDGIVDMLNEIAADMDRAQTAGQQQGKSEGAHGRYQPIEEDAERHAVARVKMGLSARQVMSEFRALRATVIRLWQAHGIEADDVSLYDLTRFNEAIDQALSDAAAKYAEEVDRSRELFLGILGHDLRNPLAAIIGFAELQLRAKTPERYAQFASQILISAGRMSYMITDLIELTRVRLGTGILINPTKTCLRRICSNVVEEMKAIHPQRVFQLNGDAEIPGQWDEARLSQVLSNLLGNAIQHGNANAPVIVAVTSDAKGVEISVHNQGAVIPPDTIAKLFDCLFQGSFDQRAADDTSTSLGLGLYIAKEIVSAHAGTIEVSSDSDGTTFLVRLPPHGLERAGQLSV